MRTGEVVSADISCAVLRRYGARGPDAPCYMLNFALFGVCVVGGAGAVAFFCGFGVGVGVVFERGGDVA